MCTQKPGALLQVKPVFAIQCIEMTSREQRLVTKEQIAMHTNLFLCSILKYFSDKTF